MVCTKPHTRKAKGRSFQQKVRDDLITRLDINPLDIESTAMGQSGCDLYLSPAARDVFPFGCECKFRETINIWEALDQAETNAKKEGLIPLTVFKRSHSKTYAVLEWETFLKLCKFSKQEEKK